MANFAGRLALHAGSCDRKGIDHVGHFSSSLSDARTASLRCWPATDQVPRRPGLYLEKCREMYRMRSIRGPWDAGRPLSGPLPSAVGDP